MSVEQIDVLGQCESEVSQLQALVANAGGRRS